VAVALVVVVIVIAFLSPLVFDVWYGMNNADGTDAVAENPASGIVDGVTWPPDGYKLAPDVTGIAYRWLEDAEFTCELTETCWGMSVVTRDGCPESLYVELAILDPSGAKIGFTNALVDAVQPGHDVRMVFENTEVGSHDADLGRFDCL
jgi:hypothetical protein